MYMRFVCWRLDIKRGVVFCAMEKTPEQVQADLDAFLEDLKHSIEEKDPQPFKRNMTNLIAGMQNSWNHGDHVLYKTLHHEIEEIKEERQQDQPHVIPGYEAAVPEEAFEPVETQEPREPADPNAKELYHFCRLVAGRANLPLREVWTNPPSLSLEEDERPSVQGRANLRMREVWTSPPPREEEERPTLGPSAHRRQPVAPPIPLPDRRVDRSVPLPDPPAPRPTDSFGGMRGLIGHPWIDRYLTNTAMAALHHVVFLIRQMNNPRVSHLSVIDLIQGAHKEMFASWIAHLIQYWRTVNGESLVYRSQLPVAILSYNLNRHYAYFSKLQ